MPRYKLIGGVVQGQDANAKALTREQQHLQPTEVVYQTDDKEEAAAIQRAGGFFRDRETFVSVVSVVDSTPGMTGSGSAQPMPQKGI